MDLFSTPFGADPQQWTETHVRDWVMWAVNEFSLKGVDFQKFCMNGAALCALGKECFLELAPDFVGDILWEHLEILQKGESRSPQGEWFSKEPWPSASLCNELFTLGFNPKKSSFQSPVCQWDFKQASQTMVGNANPSTS